MGKINFKFDSNLKYQNEAIKAVTNLFDGQLIMDSVFTISGQSGFDRIRYNKETKHYYREEQVFGQGISNRLTITHSDILENLRKVQVFHKLAPSESLSSYDFNIEMETGTGKTYVYLKTIFELNKLYGFKKFIIVVPSIAIKEGVYKTIKITKNHFKELYNIVPNSFVYDSSKLDDIRNFATSSNIEIMIINIDAFNKSFSPSSFDESKKTNNSNIIHREQDQLNGYKPIDLIAETNPIVIIDEPQSVMGGKGEEAVSYLNPLCTLRYSATHKELQNLIYKLDAVDAYDMNLVKGIEVASFEPVDYHNKAYLRLLGTKNINNQISAKLELDVSVNGIIKTKEVSVKVEDDLEEITNRDIYRGFRVNEISCEKGNEFIEFTPNDVCLRLDEFIGEMDEGTLKRAQIRKTIEEHLDKELVLNKKGIKVLSLFFIDKVSNYRIYGENGEISKGKYAEIFEQEYKDVIKNQKYSTLYNDIDLDLTAEEVHNGYFAQDRKGKSIDNTTSSGSLRKNDSTTDAFNLIMRDKEELLNMDNPLKFIFSHSALREGWDNPNVFQICTLNETTSNMKKRQEIGRGLRLCVNQDGERVHDKSINTLTVMANESYDSFARSLQSEMESDSGIKFGIIEKTSFAHITMEYKGEVKPIGSQGSMELFNHFKKMNYINGRGKIQDNLKVAIRKNEVVVPQKYESIKEQIVEVATRRTKQVEIKRANLKRKVKVNKLIYDLPDFKEFWDKIKHKTTYSVDFDTEELIAKSCNALKKDLEVHPPKLIYTKSNLIIDAGGVSVDDKGRIPPSEVFASEEEVRLPDIITFLQNETYLTRRTIVRILKESDTLDQFKKNPELYKEEVLKIIKKVLNSMLIDGIKYTQLDDYYAQELFMEDELSGYLEKNMIKSEHSVYDHIIFDSEVERDFAQNLENDPEVKLYTKLPKWFKINTPIGGYNPDWAILFENNSGEKRMYFVIETKGNVDSDSLRPSEKFKIDCGGKHFDALRTGVRFKASDSYDKFKTSID